MTNKNHSQRHPKIVIERIYRATVDEIWDLWTTKEGFESWWGPQGFRADVHRLEAKPGGTLHYDMVADSAEMIAMLKANGEPTSHPTNARFSVLEAKRRLTITNVIDFLPNVAAYEAEIAVEVQEDGPRVKMIVTLDPLHSEDFTKMQKEGFSSQLTKLDSRFS